MKECATSLIILPDVYKGVEHAEMGLILQFGDMGLAAWKILDL
jgi:hypothetical protein